MVLFDAICYALANESKEERFMEQKETLGKRIAALRKEKGLTQEQLAEKVGVSAQAVSKWENDVSCPDITLLPLLADLFDVSVDELLGVKPIEPHVIILDKDEMPKDEKKDKSFSFEWNKHRDSGKWFTIAICIGLIMICTFFLLHSFAGMFPYIDTAEVTLKGWDYAWPLIVFTLGLASIRHSITFSAVLMAIGGYETVRRILLGYGIAQLPTIPWYVILMIIAIVMLLTTIFGRKWYLRKKQREMNKSSVNGDRRPTMEYSDDNNYLKADMSFGNNYITYDRDVLCGGAIDSNFGDYTVDLRKVITFTQDCLLKVDQNFGNITILLPKNVKLVKSSDTSFAAFTCSGDPDPDATQTLIIRADVNFGTLQVKYE